MTQIYGKLSFVGSLASLAKRMSVCLLTKWFWVRISLLSLKQKYFSLPGFRLDETFVLAFDFHERTKKK